MKLIKNYSFLKTDFFLNTIHGNTQKLTTRLIEATSLSSAAGGINEEMKAFPFKSQYRSEPWGGSWGRRALAKHLQTMHLSHLVTMPFFRAACSNLLYIQPCLSDCTHQCGWFLSFRGLVLIVQYLANEGGK